MSNKTDFVAILYRTQLSCQGGGKERNKFSFLPPVCATHGSRKNWNTHPDRRLKGGTFCFNFFVISSPFYLHSVGADNKIVACSGPLSHLWGEDFCKKSLFCVFVCHKCAAFQSKARTHKIIIFCYFLNFKKISRVHLKAQIKNYFNFR